VGVGSSPLEGAAFHYVEPGVGEAVGREMLVGNGSLEEGNEV